MLGTIGYQVVVLCLLGDYEVECSLSHVTKATAERILDQWHRPWLFRSRSGLVVEDPDYEDREIFVYWKNVLDVRIQPQAEAIA